MEPHGHRTMAYLTHALCTEPGRERLFGALMILLGPNGPNGGLWRTRSSVC